MERRNKKDEPDPWGGMSLSDVLNSNPRVN